LKLRPGSLLTLKACYRHYSIWTSSNTTFAGGTLVSVFEDRVAATSTARSFYTPAGSRSLLSLERVEIGVWFKFLLDGRVVLVPRGTLMYFEEVRT
jgi:hypothetical protein